MKQELFDVVVVGRAAVDLYGEQLGSPLEDVQTFKKSVGGCAGNIAIGCARLGLKTAIITRVGQEQMGHFVRETLAREGVDTRGVQMDPQRLTGLVLLSIRDREHFPLLFYRENCADMAIDAAEIDATLVQKAKILVLTGTHLSQTSPRNICIQLAQDVKAQGGRLVLDIDYRPVLWGLTQKGEGENRYVASDFVTQTLRPILPLLDLIVGTEEEIRIAGGAEHTDVALRNIQQQSRATIVLKRGEKGCAIYPSTTKSDLTRTRVTQTDDKKSGTEKTVVNQTGVGNSNVAKTVANPTNVIEVSGRPVEVLNVLGAGDAFMAGFLLGYSQNDDLRKCGELANACGALVVSRFACSPAIPTRPELDFYLRNQAPSASITASEETASHAATSPVFGAAPHFTRLDDVHRKTQQRHDLRPIAIFAFDHRQAFYPHIQPQNPRTVSQLKHLFAEALLPLVDTYPSLQLGAIVDQEFGESALNLLTGRAVSTRSTLQQSGVQKSATSQPAPQQSTVHSSQAQHALWLARPIEVAGHKPVAIMQAHRLERELLSWPLEHRLKCLLHLPDHFSETKATSIATLQKLQNCCRALEREWVLEIIPESTSADLLAAILDFYAADIRPDWWKLPALPTPMWQTIHQTIFEADPYVRGILILGGHKSVADLKADFHTVLQTSLVRGFAVGRTIFWQPGLAWLSAQINDQELIQTIQTNLRDVIQAWNSAKE